MAQRQSINTTADEAERAPKRNRQSETIGTPKGPGVTDNQAPSFEGRLAAAMAHGQSNGHAYPLYDPRLSGSANATQKARILRKLQQVHGNRHVQSVAQRIAGDNAGPAGLPHVSRPIQHDNPKRPQTAATVSVLERVDGARQTLITTTDPASPARQWFRSRAIPPPPNQRP